MRRTRPIEVAVIGGGCAAITAAFELSRPEHRDRYRVTVYQRGWRLGGKGASGRGPGARIEEHGLHLWLGFYENAFRLLRECYGELGRDPARCRIADWRDAFFADSRVGLAERGEDGRWDVWTARFPPGAGLPGDPLEGRNPYTVRGYMVRAVQLLATLVRSAAGDGTRPATDGGETPPRAIHEVLGDVRRLLRAGRLATWTALLEAVRLLESAVAAVSGPPRGPVMRLLEAIALGAASVIETEVEDHAAARRQWELIDLILTCLRGTLRFGLLAHPRGFDAIDHYDLRQWLAENGASRTTLDSAFLRGLYDLVFAYRGGDPARPRMAAGQALRGLVRMFFTYRGALFWKMRAGMGDVVFAPFYQVLRRRGVRFAFFHRLENVRLASDATLRPGERPYVTALELDVQAEVVGGGEYRPLVDVDGLPCWPAMPDYSQLEDGGRLAREDRCFESHWDRHRVGRRTLRVGVDFDFVVLGVGIGALPFVCREIVARDRRWRRMIETVETVATQAFQLWLREDLAALGWRHGRLNLSAFVKPFDTWAEMGQLIPEERLADEPRSIAYFCTTLETPETPVGRDDRGYPERERRRVRDAAVRFLERDVRWLWPRAITADGGFRWELLAAADGEVDETRGAARFASQYWCANVDPSDRYALTLPGSSEHRISPLDNTYDNLTLAGDWTACGHNAGCVEAAVISGRLAAHALTGRPALEDIVGYDHP